MAEAKSDQTIFVTTSTGKTGKRLVRQLLEKDGVTVRAGTRNPKEDYQVKFDWSDTSNFDEVLKGVSAVYLASPPMCEDTLGTFCPLIDAAVKAGVKRFVLLSALSLKPGDWGTGLVHKYLEDKGLEHVVLRPNWFSQNFTESYHLASIMGDEPAIYSASEDGKISFIDAEDIAAAGVAGLLLPAGSDKLNKAYDLTGPEALSHDEVAEKISAASGLKVKFVRITEEQFRDTLVQGGASKSFAADLAKMEASLSTGWGGEIASGVKDLTGNEPRSFDTYVKAEGSAWQKK